MEQKHNCETKIVKKYRLKAEHYICACLNKNNFTNVQRTPGGLLFTRQWNNLQYVSNAAFLLMVYSDHLQDTNQMVKCEKATVGPEEIQAFVRSQVNYILGSNPMSMSYLVGYGSNYPKKVHHRGASIESYRENTSFIGCKLGYKNWYGRPEPNPNVIVGALVGGPDHKDRFSDDRSNFPQTEACTYNTAPLVGIFAKLHEEKQKAGIGAATPLMSAS